MARVTVMGWFKKSEEKAGKNPPRRNGSFLPDNYMYSARALDTKTLVTTGDIRSHMIGLRLVELHSVVDTSAGIEPFYLEKRVFTQLSPLIDQGLCFK